MSCDQKIPSPVQELQKFYGDGTTNGNSNVFFEHLDSTGLEEQAKSVLKRHLEVGTYSFTEEHMKKFEESMKLVSERKVDSNEDLEALRKQLYDSEDFLTSLLMGDLLDNREDADEAKPAFDNVFLEKDANTLVQLYHTDDDDIFQGVIVAAKRKDDNHAVYLVFLID